MKTGVARVASVTSETKRMPPPALYDLTELQRHANRLFGFTAQRTLELAQSLYATHEVLSDPRTDSRHLSGTVAATLGGVVDAIRAQYEWRRRSGPPRPAISVRSSPCSPRPAPFDDDPSHARYAEPAPAEVTATHRTFCGT